MSLKYKKGPTWQWAQSRKTGKFGPKQRRLLRLLERDDYRCWICRGKVYDPSNEWQAQFLTNANFPTVDHFVPKACGGTFRQDNLRIAHKKCNSERGMGSYGMGK